MLREKSDMNDLYLIAFSNVRRFIILLLGGVLVFDYKAKLWGSIFHCIRLSIYIESCISKVEQMKNFFNRFHLKKLIISFIKYVIKSKNVF